MLVDRGGDLLGQRAGVADAGGAAVADQVEAELVQVRREAGPLVVVHDDLRARGQGGLHPRLAGQAPLDGVAGQQRGTDHHLRVGGVGAGGDRGDHHRAVVELVLDAVGAGDPDRVAGPATRADRGGLQVARLVGRVAERRWPAGRWPGTTRRWPRRPGRCAARQLRARGLRSAHRRSSARSRSARSGTASWRRPAAPGPAGASGRPATARWCQVELEALGVVRLGGPGRARGPAPWRTPRRARPAARRGRSAAGSGWSPRRSGRSRRWSRTRGTCCRWWPGWPAARRSTPGP